MEYLPSRSLAALIAEHGPLEPAEAAWVGAQVADALGAVHEAGIVHGDIKPGNVLITDDGVAKITDFGVSRATWDTTATGGGTVAGTPGYFAPEVARGGDPTPASDVFSLGATLYAAVENELVCGHHDNTLAVLHAMAEGKLRPATRAGVLGRPLAAMLRLDPAHRPGTGAVERALRSRGTAPFVPAPRRAAVPAPRVTGTAEVPVPAPSAEEPGEDGPAEAVAAVTPTPAVTGPPEVVAAGPAACRPVPTCVLPTSGLPTSAPGGPRAGGSDRSRPSRFGSRRIAVLAAASGAVLAVGVGVAVAVGTDSRTPPPVAAPAEPALSSEAPADPLGGGFPASPTPTPRVAEPLSPADPAAPGDPGSVVVDYYSSLPGDIDGAWEVLSDRARDESGGYDEYRTLLVRDPRGPGDERGGAARHGHRRHRVHHLERAHQPRELPLRGRPRRRRPGGDRAGPAQFGLDLIRLAGAPAFEHLREGP